METDWGFYECHEDSYIYIKYKSIPNIELYMLDQSGAWIEKMKKGKKLPLVIDLGDIRKSSPENRRYVKEFAERNYTNVAIIIKNNISKIVGNFALGLNRPEVPTRLFNDFESAKKWALEYYRTETKNN